MTAADEPWADAGHEVGWAQVRLPDVRPATTKAAAAGKAAGSKSAASKSSARKTAASKAAAVKVDRKGRLVHPLLSAAPDLSLFRAPTDNDRIGGMGRAWEEAGLATLERACWASTSPTPAPPCAPRR